MRVFDIEEYLRDKFQLTIKPNQIYYWEQKGLLGKIGRTKNNRRNFTDEDVRKILMIFMFNEISIPIRIIRKIFMENDQRAKEIVIEKLQLIKNTIIPALEKYLTS